LPYPAPGYSCAVAEAIVGASALEIIGLAGILMGMLGVILGEAKHWLTMAGLGLLVFGLLGASLSLGAIEQFCG
jgi:hypothetical protein